MAREFGSHWSDRVRHRPPPKGRSNKSVTKMGTTNIGATYTEDELEWLKAVAQFHSRYHRYPTLQEAFAIALSLGYRKQEGGS